MAWSSVPLPPDWLQRRAWCFELYGTKCYLCGADASDVDHVKPRSQAGPDDIENLRPICTECHRKKTSREAYAQRKLRARPREQHPGEVLSEAKRPR